MSVHFPKVKAIMWFDEIKPEPQAGGAIIDWRFTGNQQINSGLAMFIKTPAKGTGSKYWLELKDFTASGSAVSCKNKPAGAIAAGKSSAAPVVATTATFSSTVPLASAPTGTSTAQNAASTQSGGAATKSQADSGSASTVASLIGRRRLD